jgi:predicted dehydrogenase
MSEPISRRNFIQRTSLAATVGASGLFSQHVYGANERIRVGVIGTANRGGQLIDAIRPHSQAEIVGLCDIHDAALQRWKEAYPTAVCYKDFREMLDRDDIDAVVIATPDHWHALLTIQACESGKDVYVEKPLSLTIHEGRRMIEAARRTNKIVQVGLQRRASKMYAELVDMVQSGVIGKVTVAHCYRVSNMAPIGIGKVMPTDPPKDLDWEMFIGPQAMRPYQENITPYKFRWWRAYSSQIGNWGVHYFDLIRWLLNEQAPTAVSAHGGRFAVDDDRTIPDTMQATYELPSGCLLVFGQYEASGNTPFPKPAEIELRGTKGTLYARGNRYEIVPESGGQFQSTEPRMEPDTKTVDDGDVTAALMGNFFDCVKSRQTPLSDVAEGHYSTCFAHLANIALETQAHLKWDSAAERFTNNDDANNLLHYEYRPPWKLG